MKAVFFDIDGTLIEGNKPEYRYMSEKVQRAIRKLQEQGHYVFIASGRSWAFLDEKIRNFGFDGYVLLNGAVIIFHDEIIYRAPLSVASVRELCKICDAHGIEYSLQGDLHTYVNADFSYLIDRLAQYGIYKDSLNLEYDIDDLTVYKLELDSPRHSDREYIIHDLPAELTYVEDKSQDYSHIEVYAKDISKATGALQVLKRLQIDVADSYAFGDGDNDIEILSTVGFGMAMANGSEKAKQSAKVVVPSIFDDGVAYGIEEYILK